MRGSLCFVAGALFMFLATAHADEARDYTASLVIHREDSPDPALRYFDLTFSSSLSEDTVRAGTIPHMGIVAEKDSTLVAWLTKHDGERIAFSLRAGGPLDRDGLGAQSGIPMLGREPSQVERRENQQRTRLRAEVTR